VFDVCYDSMISVMINDISFVCLDGIPITNKKGYSGNLAECNTRQSQTGTLSSVMTTALGKEGTPGNR
jgi:hypothetical protein